MLRLASFIAVSCLLALFAMECLSQQPTDATKSLRDLIYDLGAQDEAARHNAIESIVQRVPAISLVIDQANSGVTRWQAAEAMFFVTPEQTPVTPLVLPAPESVQDIISSRDPADAESMLSGTSMTISLYSVHLAGLLRVSGHTKVEISHLLKATSKEYPNEIRALAVATLANLGSEAKSALPALARLLDDESEMVRWAAAMAIVHIENEPDLAAELARRAKLDAPDRQRFEETAKEHLESERRNRSNLHTFIREDPDSYLPMLVYQLKHAPGPYRRDAMRTLADVGPVASPAIPVLLDALNDDDAETRQLAVVALKKIDPSIPIPAVGKK